MAQDLSFKQVCALIKKDQPRLIGEIDQLLGVALLCSPAFFSGLSGIPLITAKNELIRLSKELLDAVSRQGADSYSDRERRMRAAYVLISYTAFFEALDQSLPDEFRKKMMLSEEEKLFILNQAKQLNQSSSGRDRSSEKDITDVVQVYLPHPVETLEALKQRLIPLYREMTAAFRDFAMKLAAWEQLDEKGRLVVTQVVENLPRLAAETFEAQYFALCTKYQEFAIWANIQEHKRAAALIDNMSHSFKEYVQSYRSAVESIDVGLNNLHKLVLSLPDLYRMSQSEEIVEGLKKHYLARINDPIIDDRADVDENAPRLVFPRVCDAFVPQSFLVIRVGTKKTALEDAATWRGIKRRNDLGNFLLSYLSSPYSTDTPLVVLGHPGSGKSLLTTVLSARLLSKQFTPIRVPLREVNSEAGVVSQIEEHVGRVTGIRLDSWAKCSSSFVNNPPVVILDGYDELLQASGKVFAGYLQDVKNFQRNEAEQGRPVRVIVTSRVTLIDKAVVPQGSTIVRLLEFDKVQRENWIAIWNEANSAYFQAANVRPFQLPSETDADSAKVLQLAEQPLLLLMLALYDSVENKLRSGQVTDRTILYDSLLRRFVIREREKSPEFLNMPEEQQEEEIDRDMQRLGVAAVGMYNRRALHILSDQLSKDLRFFELERQKSAATEGGRQLSQADLLLGSFFFIHKSRSLSDGNGGGVYGEAAFEFLHNTFGEFLTADFIIRRAMDEIEQLIEMARKPVLRAQRDSKLNKSDGLSRLWFACLVYTALFTRPVVMEMIREWSGHALRVRSLNFDKFIVELDAIFQSQIARVLYRREMPSIMQKDEAQEGFLVPFHPHPLMGHLAIYSINLVIIRALMSGDPFVFDEQLIASREESAKSEDGARPWDQLTYLWRSWFSIESINGITAVFEARRKGAVVTIAPKKKISVAEGSSRLELIFNVARSLGDGALSGASGFVLLGESRKIDIDEVDRLLRSENVDVSGQIAQKKLEESSGGRGGRVDVAEFSNNAAIALLEAMRTENINALGDVVISISRAVRRNPFGRDFRLKVNKRPGNELLSIMEDIARSTLVELLKYNAEAAAALLELIGVMGPRGYRRKMADRIIHAIFERGSLLEFVGSESQVIVRALELIKAYGPGFKRRGVIDVVDRLLRGVNFEELILRRPQDVDDLTRVLSSLGASKWVVEIRSKLVLLLDSPRLLLLAENNPERVLEICRLASRMTNGVSRGGGGRKAVEVAIAKIDPFELFDGAPDGAIELLVLANEFEVNLGPARLDKIVESTFYRREGWIDWSRRSPEAAFDLLRLALMVGATRWIDRVAEEFLERADSELRVSLTSPQLNVRVFAKAIQFARVLEDRAAGRALWETLVSIFDDPSISRRVLLQLPISALEDLEWLARRYSRGIGAPSLWELDSVKILRLSPQDFDSKAME
ncbi:NACHT domain-containing protein [Bradyrhizobium sp. HKCCYLS3077]|uniref:NACHT domain-containing protein n=1 Tax=Bradyrhizobium sp. HKCCYLS3077 TaxID=3420761 RepID=UPI003EBDC179